MRQKHKKALKVFCWIYGLSLLVIYWSLAFVISLTDSGFKKATLFVFNAFEQLWFISIVLFLLMVVLICKILRRKNWKPIDRWNSINKKCHLNIIVLLILSIPIIYLLVDIPKPDPIFIRTDIPLPAEDVNESYNHVMQFRNKGGLDVPRDIKELGLDYDKTIADPLGNAEVIEKTWDELRNVRSIFLDLNKYEYIAGITATSRMSYTDIDIIDFLKIRTIVRSILAQAMLLTERGKSEEAARHLLRVHDVIQKASPYAGTLVDKMIWLAVGNINIDTIHRLLSHPKCSSETVNFLAKHYQPLSMSCVSIRTPIMIDYVLTFDALNQGGNEVYNSYYGSSKLRIYNVPSLISFPFLYKANATLSEINDYVKEVYAEACKNPKDMVMSLSGYRVEEVQGLRNMLGRMMVQDIYLGFHQYTSDALVTKANSDLLALEIARKANKELELIDIFSGKPYYLNSHGKYTSVGKDHKPDTSHDIFFDDPQYESLSNKPSDKKAVE